MGYSVVMTSYGTAWGVNNGACEPHHRQVNMSPKNEEKGVSKEVAVVHRGTPSF